MTSYSRNTLKPLQLLTWSVAAALLTGANAFAADAAKFALTAYTNGAAGDSLASGNYAAAVADLQDRSVTRYWDRSVVETNKCVAYTMTGKLDAAHVACDAAILSAKDDLGSATFTLWERKKLNDALAVAYSNRAVLNWVSNNAIGAAHDLRKALSLAPQAEVVARNISALHSPRENALAQLGVTPRS